MMDPFQKKQKEIVSEFPELSELPEFPDFTGRKNKTISLELKTVIIGIMALLLCCGAAAFGGYQLGHRSIIGDGYQIGYDEGNDTGYNEGLEMGKKDGYDIGYQDGTKDAEADIAAAAAVLANSGDAQGGGEISAADGETVYLTASGNCYHHPGCYYVEGKSNLKELTEAQAIADGYSECSKCAE